MLKPGPNYRMSGSAKRMLATIVDPHLRGVIKRSTIQAELASQIKPVREKGKKDQA